MKRVFGLLLTGAVLLSACSKKTRPATSVPPHQQPAHAAPPPRNDTPVIVTNPTEHPPVTAAPIPAPMIVIDEKGYVMTPKEKLPAEIAAKVNLENISRGYTPVQRKNLINRFKIVPPRVLYVPDQLATKNGRGTYVVYRKKFWYWKKADGLFHIDETYYQ